MLAFCLFEFWLHCHVGLVREFEAALLSLQWMLLLCLVVWCGTLIFLARRILDWPLIGLLLSAGVFYCLAERSVPDALLVVFTATLGKGARYLLANKYEHWGEPRFLVGLIGLLVFASWRRLDMSNNYYHGPRWMGLWDNPNTYGMLMGAGVVLAAGLLMGDRRWKMAVGSGKIEDGVQKRRFFLICHLPTAILWVAVTMLGVGLVMSYSRGGWLSTAIGLLYLLWCYGKLKWRYVLPVAAVMTAVVLYHWGSTPDSAPWYVKRADLGRPSAQNRATAWRAGLEIMRDHPLGVGWNKAVSLYGEKYHPPEGGPAALTTNDYMMIGTELGIPALLCFVAYVGLCYRKSPKLNRPLPVSPSGCLSKAPSPGRRPPAHALESKGTIKRGEGGNASPITCHSPLQDSEALRAACLAGALVFLVAFWFDGGLFKLPTAALFWVLLELGAYRAPKIESEHLANS